MFRKMYKPGQGKYSRIGSGAAVWIVAAIGCWQLYDVLQGSDVNLWIASMVPAAIIAGITVFLWWLLNKPAVADFLIASEGELKKVNWSSRREVAVSTLVVIIVVVVMAALLGTTDFIFQLIFRQLIG